MCGEHYEVFRLCAVGAGSSPHVRGAPQPRITCRRKIGIIPACAGSTSPWWWPLVHLRDHPRMCGEHPQQAQQQSAEAGSSPHVRGARTIAITSRWVEGIIPACAGSTRSCRRWSRSPGDHPRMCGEHVIDQLATQVGQGSSPHVRGALQVTQVEREAVGIIPACAGSTQCKSSCTSVHRDHPRMCGEHPHRQAG